MSIRQSGSDFQNASPNQGNRNPAQSSARKPVLWQDTVALALLMAATLKIMANATISPALPALEAQFSSEPGAAWMARFLVSAPSLTVVLVAPLAGWMADRIGRAPLLLWGVVLFVVAGSAGAYLPDLKSILLSRLVLGVAVAVVMTAQVALVGDWFQGDRRSSFLGAQVAAVNFGGFVFIVSAGLMASLSPRLPFMVYLLPALLVPALLGLGRKTGGTAGQDKNRDGQEETYTGGWLPKALAVGALTMITVLLFFIMPSQLAFYLDESGKDAASGTAVSLGALTLTGALVAMRFQKIKASLGLTGVFALGFALKAGGFALLALGGDWHFILPGAALIGAGYALVQPCFIVLALQVAPAGRRGAVSGIVTTAVFLGQIVSPVLLAPLVNMFGYNEVFAWTGTAFIGLAILAVVRSPERKAVA